MSFFRNLLIERKRKPYYCEVEYLESTGTQYIDTGVNTTSLTSWDIRCAFTSTTAGRYIGAIKYDGSLYYRNNFGISGSSQFATYYGDTGTTAYVWTTGVDTSYHRYRLEVGTNAVVHFDENSYTFTKGNYDTGLNFWLFARNCNVDTYKSYCSVRIKMAKLYDGGVLVRDMIPVLDFSFKPCMYDKVTRKLFYNQGTGDFQYGREIHYVDYLESSGTQYIDTGIAGSSTLRIEMEGQKSGATLGVYFGAGTGNNRIQAVYVNDYNSARIGDITVVQLGQDTERFNIVCDALNKSVTYNGTEYPFAYTSSLTNLNIFMFTRNQGDSLADKASARCWFFKIWDNNTLVRDYLPAIDENGIGFMFDKVTHTIFDNTGTGVFSYPAREVEYLEGTGLQYIDTGLDYFADFEVGIQLRTSVSNKSLGNGVYYCMQRYNANNPYWYFSTGAGGSYNYITSTPITEYHVMKWKDNKIYADDVLLTEFTKDLNALNRMYLFSADGNSKYPNVIYFCKLWNPDDGVLMRDYIPVFKDGVSGMQDKVNNIFYPNVGTGSFVAGKILESKWF